MADVAPLVHMHKYHPAFSRAVVEFRKSRQIPGSKPHYDFFLCYDFAGAEEIWMCDLAAHREKVIRLIEWATGLGVSVEYDPPGCMDEAPKPIAPAVSDPGDWSTPVEDFS